MGKEKISLISLHVFPCQTVNFSNCLTLVGFTFVSFHWIPKKNSDLGYFYLYIQHILGATKYGMSCDPLVMPSPLPILTLVADAHVKKKLFYLSAGELFGHHINPLFWLIQPPPPPPFPDLNNAAPERVNTTQQILLYFKVVAIVRMGRQKNMDSFIMSWVYQICFIHFSRQ